MIFRSWLALKFPPPVAPCGNLWLLWIHALLHSNLQEVAVKPFTHFHNKKNYGVGTFWKLLRIHHWWFGISERLLWSHLHTFTKKYWWFWKLQEAAVNPSLMVWNLDEVAVKPFAHFYKEILMVLEASWGLLLIHYWWFGISKRLLWSHLHTFTMKYLWFWNIHEAAVNPLLRKFQMKYEYLRENVMIFRSWLGRTFASLWQPVPACGGSPGAL